MTRLCVLSLPCAALTALALSFGLCPAKADLIGVSSTCQATVSLLEGGQVVQTDSETELYPQSTSTLPMSARASITSRSGEEVKGIGLSFCQFKDPASRSGGVPDELNIDATTYAADSATSYDVSGLVRESRVVRFTAVQTGAAIGDEVEFESTVYIRGLLAAVVRPSGLDLTGLKATVETTVVCIRPNRADDTVMTATYELAGSSDGTVALNLAGQAKADQVTVTDLSSVVTDLAVVKVAFMPSIAITYRYKATVGEQTELVARLQVKLVSVPGGAGVAAAFGMPGETLGKVIETAVSGATAAKMIRSINKKIGELPAGSLDALVDPPSAQLKADNTNTQNTADPFTSWFAGLCGGLGAESAVGVLMFLFFTGLRPRR